MWVRVCVCACVFTHTPVRAHRYEYVCVHVCLYIHLCMLMAWYVYTCVFAHTPVRAHGCGYMCIYVRLHIHLCACSRGPERVSAAFFYHSLLLCWRRGLSLNLGLSFSQLLWKAENLNGALASASLWAGMRHARDALLEPGIPTPVVRIAQQAQLAPGPLFPTPLSHPFFKKCIILNSFPFLIFENFTHLYKAS